MQSHRPNPPQLHCRQIWPLQRHDHDVRPLHHPRPRPLATGPQQRRHNLFRRVFWLQFRRRNRSGTQSDRYHLTHERDWIQDGGVYGIHIYWSVDRTTGGWSNHIRG